MAHELDGLINSTLFHGRTAPCACELPAFRPLDMPAECQAELLRDAWCPSYDRLARDGKGARKSRFELYTL